jgi:hypothetical protein
VAAAAGTRQYTAIFAIGGKMLASFRGVMNAANARLAKLRASTLGFGKSILKLTGVIGLLGTAIAGLGIGEILGSLFKGATDQAKEARQRVNATIAAFMSLKAIKEKGGYDEAKREMDIIYKQNELLGKQGVLHTDIYDEMTKQLALGGLPPRQIKAAMGPLGDLLVKFRGVNATEAEGAELAQKYIKAIHGKTKGMQAFGMYIDANKVNSAGKKVQKTYQEIFEEVLKIASAEGTAGFAARAMLDPEGKIQVLQNRLQDMRQEIGKKILPVQAKMAEAWLAILTPENTKLLTDAIEWLFKQLTRLVEYIKNDLLPYLKSDEGRAKLKQIGDTFIWIAQNLKPILITLGSIYVAMQALSVIGIIANPIALIIIIVLALVAAVVLLVTHWNDFKTGIWLVWKAATRIPIIGGFIESMGQQLAFVRDMISLVWDLIISNKDRIIDVFKTMGKIVTEWLLQPFKDIQSAYDKLIDAWKNRPTWLGGSGGRGGGAAGGGGVKSVSGAAAPFIGSSLGVGGPLAGLAAGAAPMSAGASAAAGALGGGIPVTVASYGGPTEPGQTVGAYNNALGPGDVAISPNLYSRLGAPGPGSYMMLDGKRYHIADASYYTPGNPTSNMVELWGYGNAIKRAGTAMRAYARGGIAATPQLASLAERGPELVVPQSKWNALGGTNVSFSPNITINGDASEDVQKALDTRLRNLARDFIENFKRAQSQERRLSYESGYG